MVLDINKIRRFIEWYNPYEYTTPRDAPGNPLWWFCIDDYEFYREDHIKKEYGYKTPEEIEDSGFYVPIFHFMVDRDKLQEKFLEENYPAFKDIVKERLNYDCFTPEQARWGEYLEKELLTAAEAWCKKYHIRYKK